MKAIILGLGCLIVLNGCATIVGGTTRHLSIRTNPSEAIVEIEGQKIVSPSMVSVKGKNAYIFTAKKEGCEDKTYVLPAELRVGAAIIGNIFSWGLLGIAVDFLNGAAWQPVVQAVDMDLVCKK